MPGYRLIITNYVYIHDLEEAKKLALKGRGEGRRTEIITEEEYQKNPQYHTKFQDLTTLKE